MKSETKMDKTGSEIFSKIKRILKLLHSTSITITCAPL